MRDHKKIQSAPNVAHSQCYVVEKSSL